MDLRGIANGAISSVNPNIVVTVLRSAGYTIGAGRRQIPTYAPPVTGPAQLQALDGDDLKQVDGLNLQGTIRAIFLRGVLAGVVRPEGVGGDVIEFADPRTGRPAKWLVVKVLEAWPTWTKAAIVMQEA